MTKPQRPPRIKEARAVSAEEANKIEQYVQQCVPVKHQIATRRALLGQMGKALALKIKCLQCVGYQREEIKLCTVITCALHPVRPYQDGLASEDSEV